MRRNNRPAEGTEGLVHQCRLPLSSATLDLVSGLVRGHLKKIRSRWRKLPPGRIALIVLAGLRHDQRLSDIAGANDVSASTVRRWLLEVLGLLAARAPRLDRALKKIARKGGVVVLLDGTLVRTRRRTGDANPAELLGQTQGPRPAVPRPDRRARQPGVDLGGEAGALLGDHHCPPQQDHRPPEGGRPGGCSPTSASLAWTTIPTTR